MQASHAPSHSPQLPTQPALCQMWCAHLHMQRPAGQHIHQSLLDGCRISRLARVAGHAPNRRLHNAGKQCPQEEGLLSGGL